MASRWAAEALAAAPGAEEAAGLPAGLDCVVTSAQTEGPYFVDERLRRADIRSDPATGPYSR